MLKSTSRAEQFYARTGSEATKGSRKGYAILGGGECPLAVLNAEEIAENKITALLGKEKQLIDEMLALKGVIREFSHTTHKPAEYHSAIFKRNQLKESVQAIGGEIRSLKTVLAKRYEANTVAQCFVELCKIGMTAAQFNMTLDRARKMAAEIAKNK